MVLPSIRRVWLFSRNIKPADAGQRGNRWESAQEKVFGFQSCYDRDPAQRLGTAHDLGDRSRRRNAIRIEFGLEPVIKLPNDVSA